MGRGRRRAASRWAGARRDDTAPPRRAARAVSTRSTPIRASPPSSGTSTSEGGAGCDPADPRFVETVGVFGVIEAGGRDRGAPQRLPRRARPPAGARGGSRLAAPSPAMRSRSWPSSTTPSCSRRAGRRRWSITAGSGEVCSIRPGSTSCWTGWRRLRLPSGSPPTPAGGPAPAPRPRPAPPPAPPGRWERIRDGAFTAVIVALGVLWYGFWTAVVVSIAGAILFGWFEEEVKPPPAKVKAVKVDRERCVVTATVQARRRLKRLNVVVDGNLRNGDPLGSANFKLGPIERGRNDAGRRPSRPATVPLAPSLHGPGAPDVALTRRQGRRGDLAVQGRRQESRGFDDRTRAMTLPGPSRTIIVEPIEQPGSPSARRPSPSASPPPSRFRSPRRLPPSPLRPSASARRSRRGAPHEAGHRQPAQAASIR